MSLLHESSSALWSKQLLSSLNMQHQPNIRAFRSSIIPSECAYVAFRNGFSTSAWCSAILGAKCSIVSLAKLQEQGRASQRTSASAYCA